MKIVRYESCIGLSLPSFFGRKIEFWLCPRNYEINRHCHPDLDIKLIFIFGHNTVFFRQRGTNIVEHKAKWWHTGKSFNIFRSDYHWFTVSKWPLLFMNIERWYKQPTSAAESFKIYA